MSCYAGLWDELSDDAWSIKWPWSNLQDSIPVSGQKVISQSNDSLVDNPWGACSSPVFLKDLKIGNLTKCSLGIPFFQGLLQLELAFDSFHGDCWSSSFVLDLSLLPRLSKLGLSNLEEDASLLLTGTSESVQHLEFSYSTIDSTAIFPGLGLNLETITILESHAKNVLDLRMSFPRLWYIEVEGPWSFLPFVLLNELTSLETVIVRQYNDNPYPELEDLDEVVRGVLGDAVEVTLLSEDGSLPLFLDMALEKYPEYRR